MTRLAFVVGMGLFILGLLCMHEPFSAAQENAKNPEGTVVNTCSACHSLDRVCNNLGRKDRDAWGKTVAAMVKNGTKLDQQEVPLVVEYLSGLNPGSKPVCR